MTERSTEEKRCGNPRRRTEEGGTVLMGGERDVIGQRNWDAAWESGRNSVQMRTKDRQKVQAEEWKEGARRPGQDKVSSSVGLDKRAPAGLPQPVQRGQAARRVPVPQHRGAR